MLRMMLSKETSCEHEHCFWINLAFQLVCWDNLRLAVPGAVGPCACDILSVVWDDKQRQVRLLAFAGLALCWLATIVTLGHFLCKAWWYPSPQPPTSKRSGD